MAERVGFVPDVPAPLNDSGPIGAAKIRQVQFRSAWSRIQLGRQRAFLRYLERRVANRALAEDILQEAFAKVIARPGQAPTDERLVPGFYATLFNAAIDQFRRLGAADRAHEAFASARPRARVDRLRQRDRPAPLAELAEPRTELRLQQERFIRPDEAITLEYSSHG